MHFQVCIEFDAARVDFQTEPTPSICDRVRTTSHGAHDAIVKVGCPPALSGAQVASEFAKGICQGRVEVKTGNGQCRLRQAAPGQQSVRGKKGGISCGLHYTPEKFAEFAMP